MMKTLFTNLATILLLSILLISCEDGQDGQNGLNSLISTTMEESGINCDTGGVKINYGMDSNANNVLDENEIQNSEYVCNGEGGPVMLDNLVRLPLGSPDIFTCDISEWYMAPHESFYIPDFNLGDYANVESVLFVPSLINYEAGNVMEAQLYNVTDDVPIADSTVQYDGTEYAFKYSGDLADNFPNYPITLAIRVRIISGTPGACSGLGGYSYLYIMRN